MKQRIAIVAVLILVATGITTASSFTTATLSRDTNINVVSDSNGVIALVDGNSGGIVAEQSNGELTIDFTNAGSATGVNVESTYELGDPANPSQRAFNITNQDSVDHTIELNYTVSSGDGVGDGASSVEFRVYDSSGTNLATEDEESGTASFTATSGDSYAVVVIIDTTVGSLTDADDLSGTLEVSAT